MEKRIHIRNEQESDYAEVERITRRAFYNIYVPGCVEHYLVRVMRGHEDFIPELDFVIELDGRIIGMKTVRGKKSSPLGLSASIRSTSGRVTGSS